MLSYFLTVITYPFVDLFLAFIFAGVAKEGVAFKNSIPTVSRGQGRLLPIFICLVGHCKCFIYQRKQKLKRHLIEVHNFASVEVEVEGRPRGPSFGAPRTMQEQNKRYNTKSRSNPLSKVAILDSKAKSKFEVSTRA